MLSYLGISSCGLKLGLFFQLHTLMKTYDIVVMWEETQTYIRVVVTYDKKRKKEFVFRKLLYLLSIVSDDNFRNKEQSMVSRRNFPPIYMRTQQHTSYINLNSYISYFAEHNIWWKGGRRQSILTQRVVAKEGKHINSVLISRYILYPNALQYEGEIQRTSCFLYLDSTCKQDVLSCLYVHACT